MTAPIDGDYITEWLVLGPFFPGDLKIDFLTDAGGEAGIQPREDDILTIADGRTLTWKRYTTKGNIIDLIDAIGDYENAIAYAFCTWHSEIAGEAQIHLGSDDGIAVWINGIQAHSNPVNRPLLLDEDAFKADLKAGANRCLVKVSQLDGSWGFALRVVVLPANDAVLAGVITDAASVPVSNAVVRLEQDDKEIGQTETDNAGHYSLSVYPVDGLYDLSATSGDLGAWQFGIRLSKGERQSLALTLKESISIEGALLMRDNTTPHVNVPVQAVMVRRDDPTGRPVATALSDEGGKYRFINLKPGQYQVRCQILGGYVYYGQEGKGEEEPKGQRAKGQDGKNHLSRNSQYGEILHIEPNKTLANIDFRFAPFKKGTWKNYSYLDGLADNHVYDIHCAPDGVMWFGTAGGISRYDGKEFVAFTTKDELAGDIVRAIHCPRGRVMWFGTWGGGVSRYDGKEFVTFTTNDGLASNEVTAIHCQPDGVMCFGTFGGVSRYDGQEFITFTTKDGLAHNWVTTVDCTPDGVMWFGTAGGVSQYDGTGGAGLKPAFTTFTTKDGLAHNEVIAVHVTSDGVVWFGTAGGVSRYDGKEYPPLEKGTPPFPKAPPPFAKGGRGDFLGGVGGFTTLTTKDGLVHNAVTAIYGAPDGVMWFGTLGGVSRYDGKGFVNFTTKDGLAHNRVEAIYRTPDGVMWFGTNGGVSRYDGRSFVNFTSKDGLVNNTTQSMYCDPDGVMWFGTGGGISRYDGKEYPPLEKGTPPFPKAPPPFAKGGRGDFLGGVGGFTTLTTQDGLVHNAVTALHRAPNGMMWFGTEGGVSRYDGKEFVNFTRSLATSATDGLAHNWINAIYGTPDDVMWFGTTLGGVSRYDGKEFITFTTQDGLAHNWVNAILHTSDGMMWFGTRGGVSRYDGKEFITFTTQDGLSHNWVEAIYVDLNGVMWFGTRGGVSCYDGKEFLNFTAKDGLAHNRVEVIYGASDGVIWFGTKGGGVSCYDGIAWASLDMRDGLANNTVTSIYQDSDGFLWFGTEEGITRYRRSVVPPPVRIVAVTTDKRYTDLDAIGAAIAGTRVTFEYSSIDFKTHPEKRLYHYKLEGYDTHWSQPTKDTRVDYADLPVGEYTFQAQAIDRDLVYSASPATARLTVQSHRAEKALRKSEEEYKRILENMIDVYYRADLKGNATLVSPSSVELLGYDNIEEVIGKNIAKDFYYLPEDRETFLRELQQHGKVINYEVILKRKDGSPIIVETNTHFVYDEKGEPIGVEGIFREITERKKAEETLKRERDFISAVIDTAGALVVVLDPQGRIVRFNRACEQTTGYSFDEARNQYFWDMFLIPEEVKQVKAAFDKLRAGLFPNEATNYGVTKDGSRRLIAWSNTALFGDDGSVEYIIGTGIDITERRRAEQALRESEEAKRIQAAKMASLRQLIAGVAHEMNNPIGVIASNNDVSSRAIDKIKEVLTQEQRLKALAILEKMNQTSKMASGRIAEIVANLRSFVRLDEAEWQMADVHEGIDNAIALMEMEPEFSSRIRVTKDYGDIPEIYCSPSSLNQVFRSMLRNSSEAIEGKGEIKIRTFAQQERVKIEISDTGRGIPAENLERIFDPGFTTKGVRVGVGLGLSVCYQIVVNEHRGRIDVASALDRGTTFTVTLPQYSAVEK